MSKKQFFISTYDFTRHERLGLECAGAQVFEFDLPDEIKTYTFKARIQFCKDSFKELMGEQIGYELISGVYTGNLKDFECTYTLPKYHRIENDNGERKGFDWLKFLETHFAKEFQFSKNRLYRKRANKIPEIKIYKEGDSGFRAGGEFLEFDESACNWAGPFRMDEKEGCVMVYGENEHKGDYPILNVKTDHSFYNLPYSTQQKLGKTANDHWRLTPEEKEVLFNSLPPKEQYETAQKFYKSANGYMAETLANTQPFKIYLAGNDDCSYTKWFSTEEDLNKELQFLRMMQPINHYLDIQKRGYIFTN